MYFHGAVKGSRCLVSAAWISFSAADRPIGIIEALSKKLHADLTVVEMDFCEALILRTFQESQRSLYRSDVPFFPPCKPQQAAQSQNDPASEIHTVTSLRQ